MTIENGHEFRFRLQTFERVSAGWDPADRDPLMNVMTRLSAAMSTLDRDLEAARASGELTNAGLRQRAKTLANTARKAVVDAEAQRSSLAQQREELRRRAINGLEQHPGGGWVDRKPAGPPSVEQLLLERELVDVLRNKKPEEVTMMYLNAVRSGADPQLVTALERRTGVLALVDPRIREEADNIRLRTSPLRPAIERTEYAQATIEQMVSAAQARLTEVSDGAQ